MSRSLVKITLVLLTLFAIESVAVRAQVRPKLGAGTFFGANNHSGRFRGAPGFPSCCPEFSAGSGNGFGFHVLGEIPLVSTFGLGLRLSNESLRGEFLASDRETVVRNGQLSEVTFNYRFTSLIRTWSVEPSLFWEPFSGLSVNLGPSFAFPASKQFEQDEKVSDGSFLDGQTTRNAFTGELSGLSSTITSLVFGASYNIALDPDDRILVSPELGYVQRLSKISESMDWSASSLRLGLSVKYQFGAKAPTEELKYTPPPPRPDVPLAKLSASLEIDSYGPDGVQQAKPSCKLEEFVYTQSHPLLNYIFYEDNLGVIPTRYTILTKEQAALFSVEDLKRRNTLDIYYNVLNIVATRMISNPSTRLRLTGFNADLGYEKGNLTLSRQRAESVRDYLVNVWGIDYDRFTIDPRNLPDKPSKREKTEGLAENRRTELRTEDPALLAPIVMSDTIKRVSQKFVFRPKVQSEAGLKKWSLVLLQNAKTVREFTGEGNPPAELTINLAEEKDLSFNVEYPFRYAFYCQDSSGQNFATPFGEIPIEVLTVQQKRTERRADKEIDRYNLMLFDYDRAEINGRNVELVEAIRKRLVPGASVSIVGTSDNTGDKAYNMKLSEERARSTARALGLTNAQVSGVGDAGGKFNNLRPEGRFYNRTVEVTVEIPR